MEKNEIKKIEFNEVKNFFLKDENDYDVNKEKPFGNLEEIAKGLNNHLFFFESNGVSLGNWNMYFFTKSWVVIAKITAKDELENPTSVDWKLDVCYRKVSSIESISYSVDLKNNYKVKFVFGDGNEVELAPSTGLNVSKASNERLVEIVKLYLCNT